MKGEGIVARSRLIFLTGSLVWCLSIVVAQAIELEPSVFEREAQQVKYAYASAMLASPGPTLTSLAAGGAGDAAGDEVVKRKSPFKAFMLSAALPGAGQYYLGHRIKPLAFLGVELVTWGMYFKYQGAGDDRTDEFEQFNRDHWSRYSYEQVYLSSAYDGITDDELIDAQEISHRLPDTETQQYFEMTGKYNQFAWGWDDAIRDGRTLDDYGPNAGQELRVVSEETTPQSARRLVYEGMRYQANRKYDQATKMIMVSIVNRLVSGFEAMFAAKRHNRDVANENSAFSRIEVRAALKSYHTKRDTPYLNLAYKF